MTETTTQVNPALLAGLPVHTEIASQDPQATMNWFTAVFGTEFMDMSNPAGPYFTFGNMELGIGGAIRPLMPDNGETHANTTPYFGSTDIDATIAAATEAGATVIVPKTAVTKYGWMAWFQVPGGAVVATWQNDSNAA